MKYHCLIAIIITLLLVNQSNQLSISLPVSQQILSKVTLSIDRLTEILKTFNSRYQNRWEIYKRVYLTKQYLNQLKNALAQYNNVIVGMSNGVIGNKNFVFGNYNAVTGSNNWVFVSKFTGNIDGDLIIGDWRIQLDKSKYILINPRFAISFLNQERNRKINQKYGKKQRTICKWDKWSKPQDQKSSKYWQKYSGFQEYKNQYKTQIKTDNSRKQYGTTLSSFMNKLLR